jgi:acyl-coenzyme A synthetase/AMP-(fatty) acid ligase
MGSVLRTGDLGKLGEDGYLFLTGRSKRIAKVFGLRINLDEIELRLREHGPAAVISEDDMIRGFCAFGDQASLDELGIALAKEFKIRHTAISLQRVSEIPTTSSDKIDYKRLGR